MTGHFTIHFCLCFNGHFQADLDQPEPELSVLNFIGAEGDGGGGDNWSYKTCKAPVKMSPPTTNIQFFFTDWIPFLSPTNSVKALKGTFHLLTIYLCTLLLPNESGEKTTPFALFPKQCRNMFGEVRNESIILQQYTGTIFDPQRVHTEHLKVFFQHFRGPFGVCFPRLSKALQNVQKYQVFNTVNATFVAHCYRTLYKLLCHSASNVSVVMDANACKCQSSATVDVLKVQLNTRCDQNSSLNGSVKEPNKFHSYETEKITRQNISSCSVLSPEIVMHDAFNVIL